MKAVSEGNVHVTGMGKIKEMQRAQFLNRFILIVFSLVLILLPQSAYCRQKPNNVTPKQSLNSKKSPPKAVVKDDILQDELVKYLGTRYQRGGSGPGGVDCSGFARLIYKNIYGIELPHNAASQSKCPPSLLKRVSPERLQPGDLIFFSTSNKKKGISHVGLYLSDGKFIHASRSKREVTISALDDNHWRSKIVSTKRLASLVPWDEEFTLQSSAAASYSLGGKNTVRLHYTATAVPSSNKTRNRYASANYSFKAQSHNLELGYTKALLGNSLNLTMTAFREQFSTYDDVAEYTGKPGIRGNYPYLSSYSQGIKMASYIKPFEWLSITPSVAYYNYGTGVDDTGLPHRSLGLDVNLNPLSNRWSLSTGFQYSNLNYPGTGLTGNNNDLNAVDMSFKYRQQVSDRMQLTLIGQHVQTSGSGQEDFLRYDERTDERLSFMLNFMY